MNPIQPENFLHFIRSLCALLILFIVSISLQAQAADSIVEADEVADSTLIEEIPNYFEKVYDHPSDSIELRHVPAAVVDSLKNDDAFWYANANLKKKKTQDETSRATPKWVNISVWVIVIVGFVAALIWYLASSNVLIFAKRRKQINPAAEDEQVSEDIFSINYQREIEKAITGENYRLAIRLMFLKLLKSLSDNNIIQYRQERTNVEYLSQLFSTAYYQDFFRLTRNYEYAWYGKFDVSREAFRIIKVDFENFERQIK